MLGAALTLELLPERERARRARRRCCAPGSSTMRRVRPAPPSHRPSQAGRRPSLSTSGRRRPGRRQQLRTRRFRPHALDGVRLSSGRRRCVDRRRPCGAHRVGARMADGWRRRRRRRRSTRRRTASPSSTTRCSRRRRAWATRAPRHRVPRSADGARRNPGVADSDLPAEDRRTNRSITAFAPACWTSVDLPCGGAGDARSRAFETPDGRSARGAVEWAAPFADGRLPWTAGNRSARSTRRPTAGSTRRRDRLRRRR